MSTPLIVLAAILALVAFILIPLMMTRDGRQQKHDPNTPVNQGARQQKKKKRRLV